MAFTDQVPGFSTGTQSRYIDSWAGCNCLVTTVVCVLRTSQWTVLCKGDYGLGDATACPRNTSQWIWASGHRQAHLFWLVGFVLWTLTSRLLLLKGENSPQKVWCSCLAWLFPAGLTGIYCVDQAAFEFRDPPALASGSAPPLPPVH